MFSKLFLYLKNLDWIMFFSFFLLICFGLAEIYSVALGKDSGMGIFNKQLIFFGIGIFLFFVFSLIDFRNFRNFGNYLYILGVLLLIFVLFFGRTIKGTKGWFDIAGFGIQPVEIIKFILIVFLARYFSLVNIKANQLKHLIVTGISVVLLIALVFIQPDFGSAMILFFLWSLMFFLIGLNKKYIVILSLLLVSIFITGWFFYFDEYQKDRIVTLFKPSDNVLEEGYNARQAMIAIGAGGIMGRGIGFGSQSQLKFLPEAQTDFIFAVVAEELGFIGVSLVLLFFAVFFYRIIKSLTEIKSDFGIYYLLGLTSLIFIQMFINIGMNIGILPIVGISLPFMSYGGSSLISTLIMVGVAQNIIIKSKIRY